jgi:2,3-bisphosphoglycerate-dependent phosphoglycerate mutase
MDVPLSDLGLRQAAAVGRWLAGLPERQRPTRVLASPYTRAATTARTLVEASGLDLPLRYDERLRERELGVLDGYTGHGIRERFPDEARRRGHVGKFYYRPPSGESWCDVALRVRSVVDSLRLDYAGERVLLASHQAVIMVFRYVLEDLSERELLDIDEREQIGNCALTRYGVDDAGRWRLEVFNDAEPLAELGTPVTEEPDAQSAVR